MKEFRIYTENVNIDDTVKLVSRHFKGFTLIHALGYWQGAEESSLIFEIIAPTIEAQLVYAVARFIKEQNKQQAVLVTIKDVESTLV